MEELVNPVKIQRMDYIWAETRRSRNLLEGSFRERRQYVQELGHEKAGIIVVYLL